jgi:hypothetical protein
MPHLPLAHHETSKRDSPNKTKIKEKQNKTILDLNSNLAKSMTHHNQTKELTTCFSISTLLGASDHADRLDEFTQGSLVPSPGCHKLQNILNF